MAHTCIIAVPALRWQIEAEGSRVQGRPPRAAPPPRSKPGARSPGRTERRAPVAEPGWRPRPHRTTAVPRRAARGAPFPLHRLRPRGLRPWCCRPPSRRPSPSSSGRRALAGPTARVPMDRRTDTCRKDTADPVTWRIVFIPHLRICPNWSAGPTAMGPFAASFQT